MLVIFTTMRGTTSSMISGRGPKRMRIAEVSFTFTFSFPYIPAPFAPFSNIRGSITFSITTFTMKDLRTT